METKANYVLIGAFTILVDAVRCCCSACGRRSIRPTAAGSEYDVVFREPVTGLTDGSPVQYNGIAVGTIDQAVAGAERPAPGDRAHQAASRHAGQDRHPRQAVDHQPHRPPDHPAHRRQPAARRALTSVDTRDDVPLIQTKPSALQNIADTANRLVERLDQVLSDKNVASISATLDHLEADHRLDRRPATRTCAR